ncbi:MAG: 4Fe-4S binding protein [Eubacteriales bacterium]|nr:4Fe-4S binding protein [Eubacteriales bacterium]
MKYVQLIFSPTGGTAKVAEAITEEWDSHVETIDLSNATDDFSKYAFQEEDIALIALPSYGGRVPDLAAQRLKQIQGNSARCVLVCVYGNRAYEDTLVEMEDIARQCGFTVAAAIAAIAEHSIMHQYATGRPDEQDIEHLKTYANTILTSMSTVQKTGTIQIPGNRPYKKAGGAGLVPKATKDCINCGLCAEQCPAKAIDPEHVKDADSKKCIACMRCVVNCPHSARKVNNAMVSVAALAIKKACSVRKECELFL